MRKILKEEQAPEVSPEKSVDAQILAFFTKAERMSIGTASARDPLSVSGVEETLRRKDMKFLFEEAEGESDEPEINIETFASEVARLIQNAEYLLDLKGSIIQMAENYLKNSHGEDASSSLTEVLETNYDLSKEAKQDDKANTNFAVGARTPTA
jgi:hypothetical protein